VSPPTLQNHRAPVLSTCKSPGCPLAECVDCEPGGHSPRPVKLIPARQPALPRRSLRQLAHVGRARRDARWGEPAAGGRPVAAEPDQRRSCSPGGRGRGRVLVRGAGAEPIHRSGGRRELHTGVLLPGLRTGAVLLLDQPDLTATLCRVGVAVSAEFDPDGASDRARGRGWCLLPLVSVDSPGQRRR
jgi:hypothetical protein